MLKWSYSLLANYTNISLEIHIYEMLKKVLLQSCYYVNLKLVS